MKLKLAIVLIFTSGSLMMGAPLLAHHGTGVAYETDKEVTLKGTVVEWIWANPHCGILFDVTDDKGNVVHWGGELGNPHQLSGAGFTKDTFKVGDAITVTGHPARSGAPRITASRFVLADGTIIPKKGAKGNGEVLNDEPAQ
jgi:hypothetical protein